MDIKWLEDLIALGKTGSFALAANLRHVTQPAFGRRIKSLESWAGVPLVDRERKPIQLTEAGKKLLVQAQESVQALIEVRQDLQTLDPHGRTLRLATGRTLARTWVADWLLQLAALIKPGQVQIRTASLADTLIWLDQSKADLLVVYHHPCIAQRPQGRGFLQKVLAHDKLVPVRQRGLHVPRPRLAEAEPLPWLSYPTTMALGLLVRDHLTRCPAPQALQSVLECDSADALLEYALKGMGLCWLPWSLVGTSCQQGLLEVCWDASMHIPFEVRLVRQRHRLSAVAEQVWQATPSR